ncbi:MAG: hypothetical protein K2N84_01405, partial [Clostridia bacterium]|nr:hypothetical protein [Clostridia bacterium]
IYGCTSLTKVVLASIQKIGANAFTRSSYNSTVTEFDFTAVDDFTAIQFNGTAFENTAGGFISIKVTVTDIAALNAVYATDWANEIKETARIANKATDNVSGNNYIDLMSGTVYSFTSGVIAKDVCKNNDYTEEDSTVLSLYYVDAEGKVIPYSSANGVWTEAAEIDASESVMTIDGVTVWKDNTYSDKYNFTDSVSGKTLSFAVSISRSVSSYGLYVSVRVPQYNFSFGEESGSDMPDLKYNISEHKFTFTATDGEYEVTLTGENTCASVKTKEFLPLVFVPEGDANSKIRVTFNVTDGTAKIEKFEKFEQSSWKSKKIEGTPAETSENVYTVTITDGNYSETYTVTYVPASDTNEASINVVLESKLASATLSAIDWNWRATIAYADGKIFGCTWFHNWNTYVDYEVTETAPNDDGTLTVTVTDDKNATRTFKLKLVKNSYDNDALEVTETTV